MLVQDENAGWVASVAGLLAFGHDPQASLSQLDLTLVVHATSRAGAMDDEGRRMRDDRRITGPILRMLPEAILQLQRSMERGKLGGTQAGAPRWEYPEEALKEVLANALIHRDLTVRGSSVQVELYPDRLEIKNPGGLFGPIRQEDLGESTDSYARNATLMRILEDAPMPGEARTVADNRGTGIAATLHALRRANMSPPQFKDDISWFRVTFPNHTLLDQEVLSWLEGIGAAALNDNQKMALALMRSGEVFDNKRYRQLANVDSRVATRELGELDTLAFSKMNGSRRWATYSIHPRLVDDVPATVEGSAVASDDHANGPDDHANGPDDHANGPDDHGTSVTPEHPEDRRRWILDRIDREGGIVRGEISDRFSVSRETALRDLNLLRKEGAVVFVGPKKTGSWRRPPSGTNLAVD